MHSSDSLTTRDDRYLKTFLTPMRECAKYKPKFGQKGKKGITLSDFRGLYAGDLFYHWVGIDDDLMYAAHKAAGGMTSIYRQLGMGCERLLREIIRDELALSSEQVAWSYQYTKDVKSDVPDDEEDDDLVAPDVDELATGDEPADGADAGDWALGPDVKMGTHTLDARVDLQDLSANVEATERVRHWLDAAGAHLKLLDAHTKALTGAVLEVRQGYKSADSKRQAADLRFGTRARNANYLPVVCIVSTQASEVVCRRYREDSILVLRGIVDDDATSSTFAFFKHVIGYDVAAFFERNSPKLRAEFAKILKTLLSPS